MVSVSFRPVDSVFLVSVKYLSPKSAEPITFASVESACFVPVECVSL